MAKSSVSRTRKPIPLPERRASISRTEVTDIEGLMHELRIKDRRTAIKLLRTLGLPVDPVAGVVLINGESFFKATQQRGGADS
ncbi:MAG: hypothetical protein ACO1RT_06090 [Planctomycetaceae bacterium]